MTRRWGISVVLAGMALLAGCGGGGGVTDKVVASDSPSSDSVEPAPSSGRLARAARSVTDAGSARFEMTEKIAVAGQTIEVTATGEVDAETGATSMSMKGSMLPGSIDIVFVDGFLYERIPSLGGPNGGANKFIRLPIGETAGVGAGGLAKSDPTAMLTVLNGGDPTEVGQEQVRGVDTTHYHGTFDAGSAVQGLPADQKAKVEAALGTLPPSFPIDVWIDGDSRVRKIEFELSLPVPGGSNGADSSTGVSMELFDYGADIDVEAPTDFIDAADAGLDFSDLPTQS